MTMLHFGGPLAEESSAQAVPWCGAAICCTRLLQPSLEASTRARLSAVITWLLAMAVLKLLLGLLLPALVALVAAAGVGVADTATPSAPRVAKATPESGEASCYGDGNSNSEASGLMKCVSVTPQCGHSSS